MKYIEAMVYDRPASFPEDDPFEEHYRQFTASSLVAARKWAEKQKEKCENYSGMLIRLVNETYDDVDYQTLAEE